MPPIALKSFLHNGGGRCFPNKSNLILKYLTSPPHPLVDFCIVTNGLASHIFQLFRQRTCPTPEHLLYVSRCAYIDVSAQRQRSKLNYLLFPCLHGLMMDLSHLLLLVTIACAGAQTTRKFTKLNYFRLKLLLQSQLIIMLFVFIVALCYKVHIPQIHTLSSLLNQCEYRYQSSKQQFAK